jgi:hypothetical protein
LVFRGSALVLVSRQNGRSLTFQVPPDDPDLPAFLEVFKIQVSRSFMPQKRMDVETVNGKTVLQSPYLKKLVAAGFERDYRKLVLRKKLS